MSLWRNRNVYEADKTSRKDLITFLRKNSVIWGDQELLVGGNSVKLKWLLDTRVALLNPKMAHAIAELIWECLAPFQHFQLCCMELTGIPLMVSVQSYAYERGIALNGFILRKDPKSSGRQRQIEGTVNDLPIFFLDDILNSGDSIQRAIATLARHGKQLTRVVALVDYGRTDIGERLVKQGISLSTLIELEELGLGWTLRLRQPNKTLLAVRFKLLDRQDHCTAF